MHTSSESPVQPSHRSTVGVGRGIAVVGLLGAIALVASVTVRAATLSAGYVGDSWSLVMAFGIVVAILPGVAFWVAGPMTLRWRASRSGGRVPDPDRLRWWYFAPMLPAFLVAIAGIALLPVAFATPATYVQAEPGLHHRVIPTVTFALVAAGCVVTFLVAWRAWSARVGAAIVLLVLLPWVVVGLVTIPVEALARSMRTITIDGAPVRPAPVYTTNSALRVDEPLTRVSATALHPMEFSHPASWTTSRGALITAAACAPGTEPLRVSAPFGTWVECALLGPQADPAALQRDVLRQLAEKGEKVVRIGYLRELGALAGEGGQFAIIGSKTEKGPMDGQLQIFVARPDPAGRQVAVITWLMDEQRASGQRGVNQLAASLKLQQ